MEKLSFIEKAEREELEGNRRGNAITKKSTIPFCFFFRQLDNLSKIECLLFINPEYDIIIYNNELYKPFL